MGEKKYQKEHNIFFLNSQTVLQKHFQFQWVNGELAITHEIGHLPFENDITQYLQIGGNNRITVEVDNELNRFSIPQGDVSNVST